MDQKLIDKLNQRKVEGNFRSLRDFSDGIDFISNDYLGLSQSDFPVTHHAGATGSRLISGNKNIMTECEKKLSAFFDFPSALVFNSGYDANLSIFSAIPQKADVVLYDEHIHASVRDGLRLSQSSAFSFKHNSISDLERLLRKCENSTIYIAIESLYSMHGDIAPLAQISELAKRFGARIILDEAHACGVIGEAGKGLTALTGISVYLKLVTFGKAFGGHGAVVLSDQDTVDYLINFGRSFIYTTALPLATYERMTCSVDWDANEVRTQLSSNIVQFRQSFSQNTLTSDELSPIQIIRFEGKGELIELQTELERKGIATKVILPPTVKKGEECLRICVHSFNTPDEIDLLTKTILKFITMHA